MTQPQPPDADSAASDEQTIETPPQDVAPPDVAPADTEPAAVGGVLAVVGIGASAGGLKALQDFVEAVPVDGGMAYVVILHLDPKRESRMGELLQDRTRLPVTQVTGATEIEANHIYIIPPDHDLAMRRQTIDLRPRGERSDHAPVDLFFRTLAEAYGPDAVGVVLSGTGADGTSGIRHIREAGGITVAQLPDESEYDGMPTSAISTGLIDLVLPAGQIPAELIRVGRLSARPTAESSDMKATPDREAALAPIFTTMRGRTGHDFSHYKRSMIMRRLDRRLRFNNVRTLSEYVPLLESSQAEGQALLRDLLISVSSFFRDPDAFAALSESVIPDLFTGRHSSDTVRVWVVGCATGEEVYSIAMLLVEHAETLKDPPRIQMFATDIDEQGYAWGRAGLYTASAVGQVTPERLSRFFTRESGGYRITKELRELVLFAGHNVLHDAPFARMDLISCRNFFIYLEPEAQTRVLDTFHFALNPGGALFLGASESIGESPLFAQLNGSQQRLFRRTAAPHPVVARLSIADPQPSSVAAASVDGPKPGQNASVPRFSYGAVHVRMLEQYAPPSVIVDERLDVVHMSADAGRFLRFGEGEPTRNVVGMASGDLRRALRTALHHAFDRGAPTTRHVHAIVEAVGQHVTVRVRPTDNDGTIAGRYALITFEITAPGMGSGVELAGVTGNDQADVTIEAELRHTLDQLEATNLAHDRTVAELQAVNEELRSVNEEQKAATEELETGREEIQSINEELTTINQEHQSTIEELKRTNADLQNLIESTEIGTIFLDRSMRIRRFTPAVCAIFNFMPADHGRPLAHITHRLTHDGLIDDVTAVLTTQRQVEREVESNGGEWYIMRINPYHSQDGDHDGVVLTFFDNTVQRAALEELTEAKIIAESADLAKGTFLATLSHEFRTPLNAILGYADLLNVDGTLTQAQQQKVSRVKAGCWHLVSMIDEILRFAKLDSGLEVVNAAKVDARTLAEEAGALIEPAASARGLQFVLHVPDAAVELFTDAGKARQILINLGGNAVKYTEVGEVHLHVRGYEDRVLFEVRDTGVGIAPQHHVRIFDRFWQVDGASTRAAGGMGIGLAAARDYARLLGGDVNLMKSIPGSGSSFCLWLPLTADPPKG